MKRIHYLLTKVSILDPFLRTLAYIKNDILKPKFEDILIEKMISGWQQMKILDLGCGPCSKERDKRFQGINITCVDIYKPYLKACQSMGFKILHADIRKIRKYLKDKSFDIVWLFDVLEHFSKKEGLKLLDEVEKIAKKQVIIFLPIGYCPQDACLDENLHQKHLSTWKKSDLEKKDYICYVFKNYYLDIRHLSKRLQKEIEPVSADAMWSIKYIDNQE